ncbi:Basic leucine zipper 9 [Zea mays]|uniref:Basic leucine zipper 9 n=1 Tax=Zea mays TaxID=4577 RepID=A0A1D6H1Q6_MAIZE|nr:Basic leucine zipper 9 [Zea mays]
MKKCPSELELEAFLRGREDATAAAAAAVAEQKPTHDDACFTGLSPAEQLQLQSSPLQSIAASLESLDNRMASEVTSCGGPGVDVWPWDHHSNGGLSK